MHDDEIQKKREDSITNSDGSKSLTVLRCSVGRSNRALSNRRGGEAKKTPKTKEYGRDEKSDFCRGSSRRSARCHCGWQWRCHCGWQWRVPPVRLVGL